MKQAAEERVKVLEKEIAVIKKKLAEQSEKLAKAQGAVQTAKSEGTGISIINFVAETT